VDHIWPQSTVDHDSAAKSVAAQLPEHGTHALWLTGGCREGWRRERGTWWCRGALTEDRAAVKRSGDCGKAAAMKACGGGELQRERGGNEVGVGCGEMRCGRGAFYRYQWGGRQPDGGGERPVVVERNDGGGGGHFGRGSAEE
jgi:hypothetical protein